MSEAFVIAGAISVITGIVLVIIGVRELYKPYAVKNCGGSVADLSYACKTTVYNNGPILLIVGAVLIICGALIMR